LDAKERIDRVNVQISDEEVQEWLKVFGPECPETTESSHDIEPADRPVFPSKKQQQSSQQQTKEKKKSKRKADVKRYTRQRVLSSHPDRGIDRINVHLSSQEVQEWMDFFDVDTKEDD
jgi:hypothetical protein